MSLFGIPSLVMSQAGIIIVRIWPNMEDIPSDPDFPHEAPEPIHLEEHQQVCACVQFFSDHLNCCKQWLVAHDENEDKENHDPEVERPDVYAVAYDSFRDYVRDYKFSEQHPTSWMCSLCTSSANTLQSIILNILQARDNGYFNHLDKAHIVSLETSLRCMITQEYQTAQSYCKFRPPKSHSY